MTNPTNPNIDPTTTTTNPDPDPVQEARAALEALEIARGAGDTNIDEYRRLIGAAPYGAPPVSRAAEIRAPYDRALRALRALDDAASSPSSDCMSETVLSFRCLDQRRGFGGSGARRFSAPLDAASLGVIRGPLRRWCDAVASDPDLACAPAPVVAIENTGGGEHYGSAPSLPIISRALRALGGHGHILDRVVWRGGALGTDEIRADLEFRHGPWSEIPALAPGSRGPVPIIGTFEGVVLERSEIEDVIDDVSPCRSGLEAFLDEMGVAYSAPGGECGACGSEGCCAAPDGDDDDSAEALEIEWPRRLEIDSDVVAALERADYLDQVREALEDRGLLGSADWASMLSEQDDATILARCAPVDGAEDAERADGSACLPGLRPRLPGAGGVRCTFAPKPGDWGWEIRIDWDAVGAEIAESVDAEEAPADYARAVLLVQRIVDAHINAGQLPPVPCELAWSLDAPRASDTYMETCSAFDTSRALRLRWDPTLELIEYRPRVPVSGAVGTRHRRDYAIQWDCAPDSRRAGSGARARLLILGFQGAQAAHMVGKPTQRYDCAGGETAKGVSLPIYRDDPGGAISGCAHLTVPFRAVDPDTRLALEFRSARVDI